MGRLKGSKNKVKNVKEPKEVKEKIENKKDIKLEIKQLKRLKLQCKPGSQERIDLHRQIKALKGKLIIIKESITPEKEEIIKKILEKKPLYYKELGIDLTNFTIEQLNSHYKLLLEKGSRL